MNIVDDIFDEELGNSFKCQCEAIREVGVENIFNSIRGFRNAVTIQSDVIERFRDVVMARLQSRIGEADLLLELAEIFEDYEKQTEEVLELIECSDSLEVS